MHITFILSASDTKYEEKGRDLTQSYDKNSYTIKKPQETTKRRRWSNDCHPTGVVKQGSQPSH